MSYVFPTFLIETTSENQLTDNQKNELCIILKLNDDNKSNFISEINSLYQEFIVIKHLRTQDTSRNRRLEINKLKNSVIKTNNILTCMSLTSKGIINNSLDGKSIDDIITINTELLFVIDTIIKTHKDHYFSNKGNTPNFENVYFAANLARIIEKHSGKKMSQYSNSETNDIGIYGKCLKVFFKHITDLRDLMEQAFRLLKTESTSKGMKSYDLRNIWE